LLLIFIADGIFFDKILCKKVTNVYKGLSIEETMILKGYLGLYTLVCKAVDNTPLL